MEARRVPAMTPWKIPPAHAGRTVAVLASGPSMSQRVADRLHIAGVPCIVVNATYRLAPWAWMLYAADLEFWQHPDHAAARQFAGLRVSCQRIKGVEFLRVAGQLGYSNDLDCVHTYGNSGAQALQIAVKSGAHRVLLCGFDMTRRDGEHWHGKHPAGLRETTEEFFEVCCRRMAVLAPLLSARGVDVVNVSPGSALQCFRRSDLEQELATSAEPAARIAALQA